MSSVDSAKLRSLMREIHQRNARVDEQAARDERERRRRLHVFESDGSPRPGWNHPDERDRLTLDWWLELLAIVALGVVVGLLFLT